MLFLAKDGSAHGSALYIGGGHFPHPVFVDSVVNIRVDVDSLVNLTGAQAKQALSKYVGTRGVVFQTETP